MSTAPAGAAAPVLEIRDLSVSFPTETGTVSAVDGVSLDLAPGEIVGMVGESGCGKSVTAMSLAGLLPGSARVTGSVRLNGTELVGARESALRRVRGQEIAYIFQEPMTSLNPVLTVGRRSARCSRPTSGCPGGRRGRGRSSC
nr:ATP-binding cassette domain-containing protein [Micromonospora tarensis]